MDIIKKSNFFADMVFSSRLRTLPFPLGGSCGGTAEARRRATIRPPMTKGTQEIPYNTGPKGASHIPPAHVDKKIIMFTKAKATTFGGGHS